jgi:2-polyprenyl-6-methoxyphenol hydroxylase-like FAD-dependent oxidoreductase
MASDRTGGQRLHVGVVGGSIAGCAAAIELIRAGYVVDVFERSRGALVGRGAGIATPMATFRSLVERDLVDTDLPHCLVTKTLFIGGGSADERRGHTAWTLYSDGAAMHWDHLYRALRRRVPEGSYHEGRTVVDAQTIDPETVRVHFADGAEQRFDLVVFADGYQSLGRRLLFPDLEVQYSGYVLWRGLLGERHLADTAPLESTRARVFSPGVLGHFMPYLVPGPGGSVAKGDRTINWGVYLAVPSDELPRFLTDRHGHQHAHSLPPGLMRPEEERRLKELMQARLPPYYAEIVAATRDTFAQPIYQVEPPAHYRGRLCLIGDAGELAPPVTGSGVLRGMTNAVDLVAALRTGGDPDAALTGWDAAQIGLGRRLSALGRQLEEALIWATPDLSQLDAAAVEEWYDRVVSLRPLSPFSVRSDGLPSARRATP